MAAGPTDPPSNPPKTRVLVNMSAKTLEHIQVFEAMFLNNAPEKKLLKLNTSFFDLRLALFVRCYCVVSRWRIQVTCFFLSWTLLVLNLPLQADPSTLKNRHVAVGFDYFLMKKSLKLQLFSEAVIKITSC